ncbi:unnamed protein product [Gadus morhua 'NCC']
MHLIVRSVGLSVMCLGHCLQSHLYTTGDLSPELGFCQAWAFTAQRATIGTKPLSADISPWGPGAAHRLTSNLQRLSATAVPPEPPPSVPISDAWF